jgi:hypothetical protein
MTFLWIDNQGLPPRHYGGARFERRIDELTASNIADALRARGIQPAALAMEYLRVDMDLAVRVLAGARKRRSALQEAITYRTRRPASAHCDPLEDLAPELAG